MKNSWNCLFNCLSKLNLYGHYQKRPKAKSKSKKRQKAFKQNLRNSKRILELKKDLKNSISSDKSIASCDETEIQQSILTSNSSSSGSTLSISSLSNLTTNKLKKKSADYSSTSNSSETSSSSTSLISLKAGGSNSCSNMSFRFDSYRVRVNSLIEIFNVFLKIASDSNYILTIGSFSFIRCAAKYLQYSSNINVKKGTNSNLCAFEFKNKSASESSNDESPPLKKDDTTENDEDVSAKDYVLQERHYKITSNYEHLCKISNSSNSNTLVKPFLLCIEKLLDILTSQKLSKEYSSFKEEPFYPLTFEINSFEINNIYGADFSSQKWLLENALRPYSLTDDLLEIILKDFNIEVESEFQELNEKLKLYLSVHDKFNKFKVLAYLIENLSGRIYLAYDELNSVQIVQYLYEFLKKLISLKEFVLVSYCLLEIILKNLESTIDLVEFKRKANIHDGKVSTMINSLKHRNLINERLYENTFFMSNLMCKQISKSIKSFICLVDTYRESNNSNDLALIKLMLNCILSRITSFFGKCILRKLHSFDSIIEINQISVHLKNLYLSCLKINYECLTLKCIKSMKLFHSLSLIPISTLNINFLGEHSANTFNARDDEYVKYEILTTKCKTPWQLYCLKKTFNLAKKVLCNDIVIINDSIAEDLTNYSKDGEY